MSRIDDALKSDDIEFVKKFIKDLIIDDDNESKDFLSKHHMKKRLKTLERRRLFLENKVIEEPMQSSIHWLRAELSALEWALPILWKHVFPNEEIE